MIASSIEKISCFQKSCEQRTGGLDEEASGALDKEAKNRTDLRGFPVGIPSSVITRDGVHHVPINIVTIDPSTARDLDDAVHVQDLENGIVEFGVHIAHVAHFVKPDTKLDADARYRATSLYLPNGVVLPMLPRSLSNGLCSLNEKESKLTFSVFFRIEKATGRLLEDADENGPRVEKTVIETDKRFNYDEVQDVYDSGPAPEDPPVRSISHPPAVDPSSDEGSSSKEDERERLKYDAKSSIHRDLILMRDVTIKIRNKRIEAGALELNDRQELHFKLDGAGMPEKVEYEKGGLSHEVIEELMLMANKVGKESVFGRLGRGVLVEG